MSTPDQRQHTPTAEGLPLTFAETDPERAERRFKTVEAARAAWLRSEVPEAIIQSMIQMADYWNLEFGVDSTDLWPMPTNEARTEWAINTKWSGIAYVLRRTQLWMPGKRDLRCLGPNQALYAFASCYVRQTRTDATWVEVSGHASMANYCDRDFTVDFNAAQKPKGVWLYKPDVILMEIAEYNAAAAAFPELIRNFNYYHEVPRSEVHYLECERREEEARRTQASRGPAAAKQAGPR